MSPRVELTMWRQAVIIVSEFWVYHLGGPEWRHFEWVCELCGTVHGDAPPGPVGVCATGSGVGPAHPHARVDVPVGRGRDGVQRVAEARADGAHVRIRPAAALCLAEQSHAMHMPYT